MEFDGFDADLFDAVEFGDFEWIQQSINSLNRTPIDINAQDINGETVLMLAIRYNHIEIVRFLLEKGADTAIKDNKGQTAFMKAKTNKYNHLIELFAQWGVES